MTTDRSLKEMPGVEWTPLDELALRDLLNVAEARMAADVARLWEVVRILPHKWALHPWGDEGGGFWVVGVLGARVIWFNDIEDGFNVSSYRAMGEIGQYWCNQDELEQALQQLLHEIQTDLAPVGAAPAPKVGAFRDA